MRTVKEIGKHLWQYVLPGTFKKTVTKAIYKRLAANTEDMDFLYMNYGYSTLDGTPLNIVLNQEDEPFLYHIQLYHHLTYDIDLKDKNVLEVGCGRGGGCHYIHDYLNPKNITGVDLSKLAIKLCKQRFQSDNITFKTGDAEDLPFAPETFDNVLNLESSHCYPNIDKFFSSVCKVLKPGGFFHFSDFGTVERMASVEQALAATPLKLIKKTDITKNVLASLRADDDRKKSLLNNIIAQSDSGHQDLFTFARMDLFNFARMPGTRGYKAFDDGTEVYISYLFQKP